MKIYRERLMQEAYLDWKPYDGGLVPTNSEFVLVLMPHGHPAGPIQGCRLRGCKPFVIGGNFAWDLDAPTHWAEHPDGTPTRVRE